MPKFDGLPDVYMGIDIRLLLGEIESSIRQILDLPPEFFDPSRPRGQALPFNPEDAPKIRLQYDPFAEGGS